MNINKNNRSIINLYVDEYIRNPRIEFHGSHLKRLIQLLMQLKKLRNNNTRKEYNAKKKND